MTSARRPAGAPDDWKKRKPAGAAGEEHPEEAGPEKSRGRGAFLPDSERNAPQPTEDDSAAAVDADLDALLADVRRERDEYLEIAQRARADFENYRKRASREIEEAERRGKAGLARELVPGVEHLE